MIPSNMVAVNGGSSVVSKHRTLAIITEYNPFHWGHAYQIATLKQQHAVECLVILMSGNVVQRGEMALVDKWARAQVALAMGADLIVELPPFVTLQGADYFAQYGVELAHRLQVDALGFGTETATASQLSDLATWQEQHADQLDQQVQYYLSLGSSYAASYQAALDALLPGGVAFDASSPNHLLGLQYVKSNLRAPQPLAIETLPRTGAYAGQTVLSGSEIRQQLLTGADPETLLPSQMAEAVASQPLVSWREFYPYLRYRLALHTPESLRSIWCVREGLEHRLLAVARSTEAYEDFVGQLVSRRWSRASIQRVLMSILLDWTQERFDSDRDQLMQDPHLRVLGFTPRGQAHLAKMREESGITLVTRLNRANQAQFERTLAVDAVRQIVYGSDVPEQNFGRTPWRIVERH